MMHFNSFTRKSGCCSLIPSFLFCDGPHPEPTPLDTVCIDENCRENMRLICVHCRFAHHKKHKTQPLEVFLKKYDTLVTKMDKIPENLDISFLEFLFKRTHEKIERMLEEFKKCFECFIRKINEDFNRKLKSVEKTMNEEDEEFLLNSLRNEQQPKLANALLQELMSKISINKEEEFRGKGFKRGPDEFRSVENCITALDRLIEKELEKNLQELKKTMSAATNRFNNLPSLAVEEEKEKLRERALEDDERYLQISEMTKRENEMLFRNYKFSQFLEIFKHDFSLMMDKLEENGNDYKKNEKFVRNKREFITEFETSLSLLQFTQKDLISWGA